ncbi:hypothetical protein B0O80DRAFT_501087 [Mortierella sp. GBAus27b]|nr:hypothetical protein B0O80DRAFT_501087 [Mortierella sp. GBAus27b]
MSNPTKASQYYRKKLEQHELTVEEWSAVRYAVIKHTLIAAATTVTLGTSAFFYGEEALGCQSRLWGRPKSLAFAFAGNMTGLSIGAVIAMESGMKTVQQRLEGSGSELLYLMDRYSKATMRERLGDKSSEGVLELETSVSEPTTSTVSARMIRPQDK